MKGLGCKVLHFHVHELSGLVVRGGGVLCEFFIWLPLVTVIAWLAGCLASPCSFAAMPYLHVLSFVD